MLKISGHISADVFLSGKNEKGVDWVLVRGNCGIQPTFSSLTKDCPNPNKNPNPNVRKYSSTLAAVCLCGLYSAVATSVNNDNIDWHRRSGTSA